MKKLLGLIAVLFAFAGYGSYADKASVKKTTPTVTPEPSPSAQPTVTSGPTETLAPSQAPTQTPLLPTATPQPSAGKFKDGEFTSDVVDTEYGPIQVKAYVSGSRLARVEFLQSPNDRENSRVINARAMPILEQEAIAAQSAQVDIVSGATSSSEGYITAMGQALAKAQ
jgi:uncharacterized protein with FMN-binding domain